MGIPDFEQELQEMQSGHAMTWRELVEFSRRLEQVWNCVIVGSEAKFMDKHAILRNQDYAGCDSVIEAFDSTEWKIGGRSKLPDE